MNNLRIIDISPHLYSGAVMKDRRFFKDPIIRDSKWMEPAIPIGGISYLFNIIADHAGKDTLLFCADRNPTLRKEILPCYKENRLHPREIEEQKEIAEIILADCGFPVYWRDGYEADDFVCALAKLGEESGRFDHIFIHTGDSDLAACITQNISIVPARKNGKHISMDNYATAVFRNRVIEYPTSNMIKVIDGDATDSIPAVSIPAARRAYAILFSDPIIKSMMHNTKKASIRGMVESMCPELLTNFDVVYPMDIPDVELQDNLNVDMIKVNAWGRMLMNGNFKKNAPVPTSVKRTIENFFNLGYGNMRV